MALDPSKYSDHIIILGRVSDDIAQAALREYGAENVIQSRFGTYPNGEANFELFVDGKLDDHPLEQHFSDDEKAEFESRISNGAYITIIHSMSGAGHVDRVNFQKKVRKIFANAANIIRLISNSDIDALRKALPRVLRMSNATSRAYSLKSGIWKLKQDGAGVISVIAPKWAFDRQDRRFRSKDGRDQYNSVTAGEFPDELRLAHPNGEAGADRFTVFDVHSNDSYNLIRKAATLDLPKIRALQQPIARLITKLKRPGDEQTRASLLQQITLQSNRLLKDISIGRHGNVPVAQDQLDALRIQIAEEKYPDRDGWDDLSIEEHVSVVYSIMEHPEYGIKNDVFPDAEDAFEHVALSGLFARDIVKRFGKEGLETFLSTPKFSFGSPDGLNKLEDVAVARARDTRDQVYTYLGRQKYGDAFDLDKLLEGHDQKTFNMFFVEKQRMSPDQTQVLSSGGIAGEIAFVIDDIAASGGTQINAAIDLKNRGTKQVHAYVCHAELIDDDEAALEKMLSKQYDDNGRHEYLFDSITITDTVPSAREKYEALPENLKKRVNFISVKDEVLRAIAHDHERAAELGYLHTQKRQFQPTYTADVKFNCT